MELSKKCKKGWSFFADRVSGAYISEMKSKAGKKLKGPQSQSHKDNNSISQKNNMKRKPFDYIKDINTKQYDEGDLEGFSPFLTKMIYSAHPEWVFLANALNLRGNHRLGNRDFYDFFYNTVPRNREFLKFPKSTKKMIWLTYIMEHYECTERQSKDYMTLLLDDKDKPIKELQDVIDFYEKRGVK